MLPVPLNDTRRLPVDHAAELEAVRSVLQSGLLIHGPQHSAFEQEFARWVGTTHAIGVATGTDAIELALRAFGVKRGDRVATVANAGGYTTTAVFAIGAEPVYIDINETLTLCPTSLEHQLRHSGPVAAIVATHLYGQLADIDAITRIAREYGCPVLEDCAQSHGATRNGQRAGSFTAAAAFSFYPTKNLGAVGDGGAVTTSDPAIADNLRMLRQYGWKTRYSTELFGGRNSRLDEIQAAVLRLRLPRVDAWNQTRRSIVARYIEAARGSELRFHSTPTDDYVAHLAVATHPRRDEFRQQLEQAGVATAIHYPILDCHQHAFPSELPVPQLPRSEAAINTILTLPCFPGMTESEIQQVCAAIRASK
jgi:dTDP-4-amino-4,6-dideoxygalactose transaminase